MKLKKILLIWLTASYYGILFGKMDFAWSDWETPLIGGISLFFAILIGKWEKD